MTAHPPYAADDPRWAITDPLEAAGLIAPDRPHASVTHLTLAGTPHDVIVTPAQLALIGTPLEVTLPERLRDEIARLRSLPAEP